MFAIILLKMAHVQHTRTERTNVCCHNVESTDILDGAYCYSVNERVYYSQTMGG